MDTEERARFGARVRQARKDAGRSQAEVAAAAGIAPNTLSAIERGGKAWAANAEAVARELGIEPNGGFPPDVDVVRDLIGEWLTPMTIDERVKARQLLVAVIAGRVRLPDGDRSGGDDPLIAKADT